MFGSVGERAILRVICLVTDIFLENRICKVRDAVALICLAHADVSAVRSPVQVVSCGQSKVGEVFEIR